MIKANIKKTIHSLVRKTDANNTNNKDMKKRCQKRKKRKLEDLKAI
jgi:hypothetical protein